MCTGMHIYTDESTHGPNNGSTIFHRGGANAAMCQQRQEKQTKKLVNMDINTAGVEILQNVLFKKKCIQHVW